MVTRPLTLSTYTVSVITFKTFSVLSMALFLPSIKHSNTINKTAKIPRNLFTPRSSYCSEHKYEYDIKINTKRCIMYIESRINAFNIKIFLIHTFSVPRVRILQNRTSVLLLIAESDRKTMTKKEKSI